VFCEVKTRSGDRFGLPAEAVGREKQARLRRLGAAWLAEHRPRTRDVRFDVASVVWRPGSPPAVDVIEDAF
jgi:putative endonuclease